MYVCVCVCVCARTHVFMVVEGGGESDHMITLKIDQYNYMVLVLKYMLDAL